jgi:hypothetical protein
MIIYLLFSPIYQKNKRNVARKSMFPKFCFPPIFLKGVLLIFTLFGVWGLYQGALINFPVTIFSLEFWVNSMANKYRHLIKWDGGYTILSFFALGNLSTSITQIKRSKFYLVIAIINLLVIVISSFAYSTRLRLVYGILIIIAYLIRNKLWKKRVKTVYLMFILSSILLFLVWGSGVRGSTGTYSTFTSSRIDWSIKTFTDYFVTTTSFTLIGLNEINPEQNIYAMRESIGSSDLIHGYTNSGKYYFLYSKFGFFTIFALIFEALLTLIVWKKYSENSKWGLVYYPLFLYALFESLRIPVLYVIDFQVIALQIFIITIMIPEDYTNSNSRPNYI